VAAYARTARADRLMGVLELGCCVAADGIIGRFPFSVNQFRLGIRAPVQWGSS
jgi:hypothetical protein